MDQEPEFIPDRVIAKNFAFGVLGINRQIRKEALRVCLKENTWIHIILISQDTNIEADKELSGNLAFRLPQAQIRIRADDMPAFIRETSLGIYLESGLKTLSIKKQNTAQENEVFLRVAFAYTQRAFAYLCHDLCRYADVYPNMILVFGREYPMRALDRRQKIIFPLSLIFGMTDFAAFDADDNKFIYPFTRMTTTFRKWSPVPQIPSMWEVARDEVFATRDYAQAAHFYDCSQDACGLHYAASEKPHIHPTLLERNEWLSLQIDLANNVYLAINKLVESRRLGSEHRISGILLEQLDRIITESERALSWPGLLESQRQKAHFCRTIAYRNRAEWEVLHATVKSEARRYFEEAAKDFFYAEQLMKSSERKPELLAEVNQALGRPDTTIDHAPLLSLRMLHSALVLQLDSRLTEIWDLDLLTNIHLLHHRAPAISN